MNVLYEIEKALKKYRLARKKNEDDRDYRRCFTHTQQVKVWHRQDGICKKCEHPLDLRTVIYHHTVPWSLGGKTEVDNCNALCPNCHQLETYEFALSKAEASRSESHHVEDYEN